jgi:hypothetical protein
MASGHLTPGRFDIMANLKIGSTSTLMMHPAADLNLPTPG